jgi:hypothetical protein
MKQYLLAVHGTHGEPMPPMDEMQQMFDDVEKVNQEMREKGAWVFGGGLTDPSDATVVRAERGQVLLTDGPYVETKEQIGGFWVIRARDLDEALAWAGKASVACRGPVEVRPFQEEDEVPSR